MLAPRDTPNAERRPGARGSHLTPRWREMDSNHRYRIRNNPFGYPVRSRNSPSATKTGSFVPGTDGSNPFPSSGESHRREPDSNHRSLATTVGPVMENVETFADARRQAIPQYDATGMLGSALS